MKRAGVITILVALVAVFSMGDQAEAGRHGCGVRRARCRGHRHHTTCCATACATCESSCDSCGSSCTGGCDACSGGAAPADLPGGESAPAPAADGGVVPPPPGGNPNSTELRGSQP
ncbi:MAG: hypothetical protein KF861_01235 [Planctomycetaceae bacterium]|nr:hypothetical protein [Planctomycetaceae bacterium]